MNAAALNRIALELALGKEGYAPLRELPTGELAGVMGMCHGARLAAGLDGEGCRAGYVYRSREAAEAALAAWDGRDDPPGEWLIRTQGLNGWANPALVSEGRA